MLLSWYDGGVVMLMLVCRHRLLDRRNRVCLRFLFVSARKPVARRLTLKIYCESAKGEVQKIAAATISSSLQVMRAASTCRIKAWISMNGRMRYRYGGRVGVVWCITAVQWRLAIPAANCESAHILVCG